MKSTAELMQNCEAPTLVDIEDERVPVYFHHL